jgi:hypothetical protein
MAVTHIKTDQFAVLTQRLFSASILPLSAHTPPIKIDQIESFFYQGVNFPSLT